jgi:hypothetical protein
MQINLRSFILITLRSGIFLHRTGQSEMYGITILPTAQLAGKGLDFAFVHELDLAVGSVAAGLYFELAASQPADALSGAGPGGPLDLLQRRFAQDEELGAEFAQQRGVPVHDLLAGAGVAGGAAMNVLDKVAPPSFCRLLSRGLLADYLAFGGPPWPSPPRGSSLPTLDTGGIKARPPGGGWILRP